MSRFSPEMSPRERLVYHVQELERLEAAKKRAAEDLKDGFNAARSDGYDQATLKVVLKLRKMTPDQRRRAARARSDLHGVARHARRRCAARGGPASARPAADATGAAAARSGPAGSLGRIPAAARGRRRVAAGARRVSAPRPAPAPALPLKDPAEARQEGTAAAAAGKRIYDNPYPAGDPCRAAWDEGWCAQSKSHGMETPAAFQRRTPKPPPADKSDKPDKDDKGGGADGSDQEAA